MNEINTSVQRLCSDLVKASSTLSDTEARFLVDSYYTIQANRIRSASQMRSLAKTGEPNELFGWLTTQSTILEKQIVRALDKYTNAHKMGNWMREIYGIGPILSAGILANISMQHWKCKGKNNKKACKEGEPCTASCGIVKVETVGHIWRYAGLDPTQKWEKGKKRPWNSSLKSLCWKIGQSFMKLSNHPECFYGHLYLERKQFEIARNERGENKELALTLLNKVNRSTESYKHLSQGKLPPAQIDARARRWAVKIFLSHLHAEWYRREFNTEPPKPFAISVLGHAHMIEDPSLKNIKYE